MAHLIHHWITLAPLAAAALLVLTTAIGEPPWLLVGCVAAIIAAVLAAVHHAEVIAHRVGEPLGTLYARPEEHALPPSRRQATLSLVFLLVALVSVVGLAKVLSHPLEEFVEAFHLPRSVVGIVVAMVVLLPETWAAIRAAYANRLQSSMNLAIGSALATIGLTAPVVVFFANAYGLPLVLGLEPKDIVLLATALLVSVVTLGTGRTSMMQGAVHLVLFATYLFLACVP